MSFRSKTWPWVVSITLHVAVLALIGLWAYDYYEGRGGFHRSGGGGSSAKQKSKTETASEALQYQQRRVSTMPADAKLEELKSRLDELDAIRFRDVRGAAGLVETLKGVKRDRWYRPNPAAKGKFEANSATLFDITRRVKDGRTLYVYTLVDAEGRTKTAEVSAERMSPDEMRTFELFEMARRNPKLRHLVEAALRIGENMVREGNGKK